MPFTTGYQPGGYELDRIDTHISNGNPSLALHANTSSAPGSKLSDFRNPSEVKHRVYTRVVPFLAPDCAGQTLAASTTYWIVFGGTSYKPKSTDADDQMSRRRGWFIGNVAVTKTTGAWSDISGSGTIPVEIWARERHPAQGRPLARGERKVGAILTADIGVITDPDGLTDPLFEYQWQRVDGGTPADITGAMSDTYTLTDDDAGTRIRLRVTFRDDSSSQETLTGPATSLIVPEPRILASNLGQPINRDTMENYTSGFIMRAHPLGYAIDSIALTRSQISSTPSASVEFRLFTSTSNSNPINRTIDSQIMTVTGPDRVSGAFLTFGAPSKLKLDPSATYHAVLTGSSGAFVGCNVTDAVTDSSSLDGFSFINRINGYLDPARSNEYACRSVINGFELMSSKFVQSMEFTSSPAQPGMYAAGEVMEATATLSEAVTVDGSPPALLLQIGDNEREMAYAASASTATSWVFRYRVTADDRDDDGVSFERNALQGYADADLSNGPLPSSSGLSNL